MGSLRSKSGAKSFGTIGAGVVSQSTPAAPKPWDSDVFAPAPENKLPKPKLEEKKKKDKPRSSINRGADRQLGVLDSEGY
jgi:hypothetical protein